MTTTNSALSAIDRARARLAEIKAAQKTAVAAVASDLAAKLSTSMDVPSLHKLGWKIDESRPWNDKQLAAINSGLAGKSFCLIGAAGTGKTSTLKGLVNTFIMNNMLPIIGTHESTKVLVSGKPGIILCSFTNMAVRQIAKHFTRDVTTCTIHSLIEFEPFYFEVEKEDGTIVKSMEFRPARNKMNKLPSSIRTIVVDESSMVQIDLMNLLYDALPDPAAVQFIFLGDLNQLPPVYGEAILGKMLLELPIVELTEVYRQALLSPIISLATKIKDGLAVPLSENVKEDCGEHGLLVIKPWSKSIHRDDALNKAQNFSKAMIKEGLFDPYKDMILCPYNVNFGVIELNLSIADWLGRERDAKVYEVIAGFKTHYLAVGDKMLVNMREAIITKIEYNTSYQGKHPTNPEKYSMDRWGGVSKRKELNLTASEDYELEHSGVDVDAILADLVLNHGEITDRKTSSSHKVTVRFINGTNPHDWTPNDNSMDTDGYETAELSSAGAINEMLFAYAITVHKSQGSEWRKVVIFFHADHAKLTSRELVYTAITRAAKELYIICEPDRGMKAGTLTKAAKNPRLKGNTLAEKLVSLQEKFAQEAAEKITTEEDA